MTIATNAPAGAIILVAMQDELEPFLALATETGEPVAVGNAVHHAATVGGRSVLLVRTGIGLVNAAAAATAAILTTGGSPVVISAGSAGGVGADVRVGEVVFGTEYINTGADARAFGYVLGQVPGMPPSWSASEELAAASAGLEVRLGGETVTVRRGLIVSSDAFVSAERVDGIRAGFPGALATDMESVAIAQVCASSSIRFASVRGISDLCGPVAGSDFLAHVDDAADRSAAAVLALLERMPAPATR